MSSTTTLNQPNQTVYINNLNEKLKLDELKMALYSFYSQFGPIMDIQLMKTARMRGQAFIAFDSISAASEAIRQTQGYVFYDRPIRIDYAKSKSDIIAKKDGTFVPRPRQLPTTRSAGKSSLSSSSSSSTSTSNSPNASSGAPTAPATSNELLVSNIPADQSELALNLIFRQCTGFVSLHMLPPPEPVSYTHLTLPTIA